MCAICGVVDFRGIDPSTAPIVESMGEAMRHRGPDDAGFYQDACVALGVRRLSVIDVSGGHQPIANEDRTVWVAFNGEIYNHRILRRELTAQGHQFATQSDTEVIVHLYEEQGERCVETLRGMFAIAIWDAAQRRLVLARDRVGMKPLYYAQRGASLLFASELRGLLKHPAISRTLDLAALDEYLLHEYVPAPHSIIEGVRKLPPGHRLIADSQETRVEPYWQWPTDHGGGVTQAEATAQFRKRLTESVRLHLQSDVPVGVLLSGGLDSSALLAISAKELGQALPAFTVGFDEPSFDETRPAQEVASALGVPHHVERLGAQRALEVLEQVVEACDEPLGDSSAIPTWVLSRLARSRVTVALSGDGGDELFAGYPTYVAHRRAALTRRLPAWIRGRWAQALSERLPVSTANFSLDFKIQRFLRGVSFPTVERHKLWMGAFGPQEKAALYTSTMAPAANGTPFRQGLATVEDPAQTAMALDQQTYLPDDLLVKVDRMSMAHSLEVRVPFLDHPLIEFAASLPASLLLRKGQTKALMRRALQGFLPAGILRRPKKGFGMPVAAWLCGPWRQIVADRLSPARLAQRGLWNADYVQQLLREHWARHRNHAKLLWTLFMFERWCDRHAA